jgi:hypothetical protein
MTLKFVNLTSNQFTKNLTLSIGRLKSLETLDLSKGNESSEESRVIEFELQQSLWDHCSLLIVQLILYFYIYSQ